MTAASDKSQPSEHQLDFPDKKKEGLKKLILNTDDNLRVLLEHKGYIPYLNAMNTEIEVIHNGKVMEYEVLMSKLISECARFDVPKAAIGDHLHVLAKERSYHPIVLYLADSKWDGVERVKKVIGCIRSKRPEVTELIMRRWLVGCIAALYEPRFSSKLVPVLQSKQSFRKTAFLSRIGDIVQGAFLGGRALDPRCKDSVLPIIKSWIVELGELESSTKHSQGQLKAFISQEADTIRLPYARTDLKKPRQTLLIATVNGQDFLKDRTGNTRFGVIELNEPIDMTTVNRILGWQYNGTGSLRQEEPESLRQFWLEVKHMYEAGEPWVLSMDEQALVDTVSDKYLDKGRWYKMLQERISMEADDNRSQTEWLAPGQISQILGIPCNYVAHVGRALQRLADEGKIETRYKDGYRLYLFPSSYRPHF
ncbi:MULTISPECIES: VapE domain-containing protein [Vibrio]|uniref:VapE domain-containing protein n=1 Tax=Vibrio TaxID=662 RepID=UPI001BD66F90|nr:MULTISPECIES: VapE domain-containing protein [Vibrio]MBT0070459.1 virulence protein [Vibrio alginolyticus]MCK8111896.1 virulence-associated E family protein [Vibrio sp. 2CM40D]MCR9485379.1 virulence-associated E family protein [Vibrio alginolyticus]MDW1980165.1 VapE family protein [Vibrio sp. Vb0304]